MIGILGSRGIGKTTFMLQYLRQFDFDKTLYFSANSILNADVSLYEIAETFSQYGGEILAIDEIHKYENFEIELKEIYDFLDLRVLFSGSSAISLEHSKADLSRRAVLYRFRGLSFREFLELELERTFPRLTLSEILNDHLNLAGEIARRIKPLMHFRRYLEHGYYPYYFEAPRSYPLKVEETVNTVIENDLVYIFNIDIHNIHKLKRLVKLLCAGKPYELNFANLTREMHIGRETLYKYIHYLTLGNVLKRIDTPTKRLNAFQKPAKLYLDNPNLTYILCSDPEIGTIREQFFINALEVEHHIHYSRIGDFLVDEKYVFEIGGKHKGFGQIREAENAFVAADDIEVGFGNKIPLWLFGFLY
jgi:predicted AAA+ superfamily ATPase